MLIKKISLLEKKIDLLHNQFIASIDNLYDIEEELLDVRMEKCHDSLDYLNTIIKKIKYDMEKIMETRSEVIDKISKMENNIQEMDNKINKNINHIENKISEVNTLKQNLNIDIINSDKKYKIKEEKLFDEMAKFVDVVNLINENVSKVDLTLKSKIVEYDNFVQNQSIHVETIIHQSLFDFEKELVNIIKKRNKKGIGIDEDNMMDKMIEQLDLHKIEKKQQKHKKQKIK